MAYVYRHIRTDTGVPFYVGIGSDESYKRAYCTHNRNFLWNAIIKKTNYEVEIIMEHEDYEFIKNKEIEFIRLYGRRDLKTGTLVNLTDGGQGRLASSFSEEEIEKRKRYRGEIHHSYGKKLSEEHKKAIGLKSKGIKRPEVGLKLMGRKRDPEKVLRGEKAPFFGKTHTQEVRKIISENTRTWIKNNGHPMLGNKNESLRIYNINTKKEDKYWFGRKLSESHKKNLRIANIGKKRSEETCENNRQDQILRFKEQKHPRCKYVLNLETGVFHESAKEAHITYGYKKTTLIGMLNGSSKNKTNLIYV